MQKGNDINTCRPGPLLGLNEIVEVKRLAQAWHRPAPSTGPLYMPLPLPRTLLERHAPLPLTGPFPSLSVSTVPSNILSTTIYDVFYLFSLFIVFPTPEGSTVRIEMHVLCLLLNRQNLE